MQSVRGPREGVEMFWLMVVVVAVVTGLPPGGGDLGGMALPNLNTFSTPTLSDMKLGPVPRFRGMICCPATGFGSKAPNGVTITPGLLRSVANAGRSAKALSRFVSLPVVMSNGRPELATKNELILNRDLVW